jgi:hypothetical protein
MSRQTGSMQAGLQSSQKARCGPTGADADRLAQQLHEAAGFSPHPGWRHRVVPLCQSKFGKPLLTGRPGIGSVFTATSSESRREGSSRRCGMVAVKVATRLPVTCRQPLIEWRRCKH